jgi:hypothetical protein
MTIIQRSLHQLLTVGVDKFTKICTKSQAVVQICVLSLQLAVLEGTGRHTHDVG